MLSIFAWHFGENICPRLQPCWLQLMSPLQNASIRSLSLEQFLTEGTFASATGHSTSHTMFFP